MFNKNEFEVKVILIAVSKCRMMRRRFFSISSCPISTGYDYNRHNENYKQPKSNSKVFWNLEISKKLFQLCDNFMNPLLYSRTSWTIIKWRFSINRITVYRESIEKYYFDKMELKDAYRRVKSCVMPYRRYMESNYTCGCKNWKIYWRIIAWIFMNPNFRVLSTNWKTTYMWTMFCYHLQLLKKALKL